MFIEVGGDALDEKEDGFVEGEGDGDDLAGSVCEKDIDVGDRVLDHVVDQGRGARLYFKDRHASIM